MFDDLTRFGYLDSTAIAGVIGADAGATDITVALAENNNSMKLDETVVAPGVVSLTGFTASSARYSQDNPGQSQSLLDNPLHDYQSYTYCLSWHMLGMDAFNSIVNDYGNGAKYVPKNVLISSAGKWDNLTFVRNSNFKEDFYFENLKLKTIINTTKRNRNSNLIECDFTLIEPAGFTLINRLLAASKEIRAQNDNYIHMPYVLQIDFYGYTDGDSGPKLVPDQTKIIPIRLTALKSKITSRGTEYQVSAVPFNHQAFSQINVASPAAFSVTGKTVKNFFGSGNVDVNYLNRNQSLQREEQTIRDRVTGSLGFSDAESDYILNRLSLITASAKDIVGVSGYCDAINAWFKGLVSQNTIKIANEVRVEFDPEIANATLYPSATQGPVNVAQAPAGGSSEQAKTDALQSAGGINKGQLNFNGTTLTIPANTSIDKLIDWAVRNSSYIGSQIKDPTLLKDVQGGKTPTTPLKWYRIVPKVKIINYDMTQNKYALEITYYVKTYTMSSKYPYAPRGRVPGYVKKYDYIYTGKNKDVIDMQIDFDMMYYVKMSAFRTKQKISETAPGIGSDSPKDKATAVTELNVDKTNPANNLAPVSVGVNSDSNTVTRTGGNPQLAVDAANLQDSLLLDARGDMINLDLKIIGDPQLIKQDDVFYGQDLSTPTGPLTKNGSLWMDSGELYTFVNFKSPTDYDEATGLADPDSGKYKISEYSGVYKIITIDNTFSRGKFEQTLNLVKLLYDQEGKPIFSRATAGAVGATSGMINSAGERLESSLSLNSLLSRDLGLDPTTKTVMALLGTAASGDLASMSTNAVNNAVSGVVDLAKQRLGQEISDLTGAINVRLMENASDLLTTSLDINSLDRFNQAAAEITATITDAGFAIGDFFT